MRESMRGTGFRALLAAVLFCAQAPGARAAEWKIQHIGGRDYLPLSQVAVFYRLRVSQFGERGVSLSGGGRRLDFAAGTREAKIDGAKHWLSYPVVLFAGQYYLSRMDLSKTVDPVMRPQKIPGLAPARTIVLDPGHGGFDRGAVNANAPEKHYNLDICRRIRPYLQAAGFRVVITRSGDNFIPLEGRPAVATRLAKDDPGTLFVSIHCNDSGQRGSAATGFEIYALAPRGAPNSNDGFLTRLSFSAETGHRSDYASYALATSIYGAMLGRVPMFDRGVKRARFAVLRRATTPAVLVECGFMSNPRDARMLASAEWRDALADAIARGIAGFGALTRGAGAPKLLAAYRAERLSESGAGLHAQALAGLVAAIPWSSVGERGWRDLLPAPIGDELPPFRLDLAPHGWAALEAHMESGEEARGSGGENPGDSSQREWPEIEPPVPGIRDWRALTHGLDRGVLSYPPGAPVADEDTEGAP